MKQQQQCAFCNNDLGEKYFRFKLGFKTGFVFSLVNGKAWAFHLTLMGVFGMLVGSGYLVIIGLVVFVSIIGFAAIPVHGL